MQKREGDAFSFFVLVGARRHKSLATYRRSFELSQVRLMLQPAGSPIPLICISPASPEKPQPAPCSPIPEVDNDGFRAKHLSPPPNISPSYPSSLRRSSCFVPKGLSREQLDVLLKVSRERKAIPGGQKAPDLRKELAVKTRKESSSNDELCSCPRLPNRLCLQRSLSQKLRQSHQLSFIARCLRQGWNRHAQCSRRGRVILCRELLPCLTGAGSSRLISAYSWANNALQAEQVVLR